MNIAKQKNGSVGLKKNSSIANIAEEKTNQITHRLEFGISGFQKGDIF